MCVVTLLPISSLPIRPVRLSPLCSTSTFCPFSSPTPYSRPSRFTLTVIWQAQGWQTWSRQGKRLSGPALLGSCWLAEELAVRWGVEAAVGQGDWWGRRGRAVATLTRWSGIGGHWEAQRGFAGEFASRCSFSPAQDFPPLWLLPRNFIQTGPRHLSYLGLHAKYLSHHSSNRRGMQAGGDGFFSSYLFILCSLDGIFEPELDGVDAI